MVWSLETLAYYLKGCHHFDLWTNHNHPAQAMDKKIRSLTDSKQKFRDAIQAYNVTITQVRGVYNKINEALSRAPLGGPEGIEKVLNRLRSQALYTYNMIRAHLHIISATEGWVESANF